MQGFKDHTEGTAHTSFFFFVCVCVPGGDLSHSTRIRNRSKKTKEYSTWLKDEISKKKKKRR